MTALAEVTQMPEVDVFAVSRERFEVVVGWLQGEQAGGLEHAALEMCLQEESREVFRQLFQDHCDLRALQEQRLEAVVDVDQVARTRVETSRRALATVFGPVDVQRLAYRAVGAANLHPADGALNLPVERHSHGLRRLAAIEATRGSFDGALEAIDRGCGQQLGKRQAEQLARRAAVDFDDFYTARQRPLCDTADTLVLSCDGKGIVMRPDALRPATAKAATSKSNKLTTRLSRGEKANRKRMAEVGAVYDATPACRTPGDIIASTGEQTEPAVGPAARNKWLTASVVDDAAAVVSAIFDEADRRDPDHVRSWVALVDGNNHQISRIKAEAKERDVQVAIVVDFIHVLEYIWSAAWSFHTEGDPAAERWVADKATQVLAGNARRVATSIRRKTTRDGLDPPRRKGADACVTYLVNKADHLDYPAALASGWPIATGIIEYWFFHEFVPVLEVFPGLVAGGRSRQGA